MSRLASRVLCSLLVTLSAGPAAAEWREATSDHFVVYADVSDDYVRRFAERLERVDAAMRFLRGGKTEPTPPSNRVVIYVAGSVGAVQKLCGRCPNVVGFYVPRAGGSVAYTPRGSGIGQFDLKAETVLFHEYAHHFLLASASFAAPRWFVEGYAEFYGSTSIERDGGVGVGQPAMHRAYGLLAAPKMSVQTVLDPSGRRMDGQSMDVFYGRSWLLMHYLMVGSKRRGQLGTYLTRLNEGKANLDAATEAFGNLDTLDRELEGYLRSATMRYYALSADKVRVGSIAVRTLSAGEAALMPVRMRSDRGVSQDEAAEIVVDARRRAAPYPNDAGVQAVLAEAEYDAGNDAEADAAADRALAADPKSLQALLYKGRVAMRRAQATGKADATEWTNVRRWFQSANKLDNDAAEPLMLYYQTFLTQGITPTANAIDALVRAYQLSPQDRSLRMLTARQLLISERKKEARTVLLPLAYDPHARGPSNHAARLVQLIDEGLLSGAQIAAERPDGAESAGEETGGGEP